MMNDNMDVKEQIVNDILLFLVCNDNKHMKSKTLENHHMTIRTCYGVDRLLELSNKELQIILDEFRESIEFYKIKKKYHYYYEMWNERHSDR